jgi:hypothetical protein
MTPTPDPTTDATAPLTTEQIDHEVKRIMGALCYELDRKIVDDVYVRVTALIAQARANEHAALRDRLARAEAETTTLRQTARGWVAMIQDKAQLCEMRANGQYRDRVAKLLSTIEQAFDALAAPTDGAARAGDAEMVERIRALHFAIPFTINTADGKQTDGLAAKVSDCYLRAYGVRPDDEQMRRACGLPTAGAERMGWQ